MPNQTIYYYMERVVSLGHEIAKLSKIIHKQRVRIQAYRLRLQATTRRDIETARREHDTDAVRQQVQRLIAETRRLANRNFELEVLLDLTDVKPCVKTEGCLRANGHPGSCLL